MIRDPSDGTVRNPHGESPLSRSADRELRAPMASGLPIGSMRPDQIERLQRSREWLKKYRTDPEGVARKMGIEAVSVDFIDEMQAKAKA